MEERLQLLKRGETVSIGKYEYVLTSDNMVQYWPFYDHNDIMFMSIDKFIWNFC